MTRGNARELALHLIYAQMFTGEDPEALIGDRLDKAYYQQLSEENEIYQERPSKAQKAYLTNVVSGVCNHRDELNDIIRRYSIGWDVSRITNLSRAALQLALYEAQNVEDVPVNVAISEAVRLAKKYDGDEAGAFVNGILGTFARSMTPEEAK